MGLKLIGVVAVVAGLTLLPPSSPSFPLRVRPGSPAPAWVGPAAPVGPAAVEPGCGWVRPVVGPVVDPFRAPDHPYGPGNRGLEYGAAPDAPVVAVAAGQVTFSGPVAGRRYLVITHGGGLRSTYGPLLTISVVQGQVVGQGQVVATAEAGFHLTARVGDRYVDPQPLLDGRCGRPRLIPLAPGFP